MHDTSIYKTTIGTCILMDFQDTEQPYCVQETNEIIADLNLHNLSTSLPFHQPGYH